MSLAPAVVVYDRAQIASVVEFHRPVTLLSPPGFAAYGGCLWWQAIVAGFDGVSLLDCGDAAGRAVEAMRLGLRGVVLAGDVANFAQVGLIAAACGVVLLDTAPPALDLAVRGADRHLLAWLGQTKGEHDARNATGSEDS
ncbi:MAG: hypothetical protein PHT60_01145 [Acidiphilium sp.]|nr:hypothetical protein [Acidiphilium sp.]MDD4934362.1 hypothetical protein [Acidiphilium sp.]